MIRGKQEPPSPVLVENKEGLNDAFDLFNTKEIRSCEIPSANAHASGRALAKIAATIVEGGALSGSARLLSPEGCKEAHAGAVEKKMFHIMKTSFTNAGWNQFESTDGGGRSGYVGWMGLGGSVMQWHPVERIGFGYAMNLMEVCPGNERGRVLQEVTLKCARRIAEHEARIGFGACQLCEVMKHQVEVGHPCTVSN